MADTKQFNRDLYGQVMVPNYSPPNIIPVKGQGSRLTDQDGNEYIDFAGGIAVSGLGHCHPRLVAALKDQADKVWHLSNVMANEPMIDLAKRLTDATFADRVYFCNSGAEANESALKLARRYAYDHHGAEKNQIISFKRSFHGRTLFTVSVGGQPKYTEGFGPVPPAIDHAEFNHIDSVKALISDKTCAVILEPIQAEGGIFSADKDFLKALRALCDQHNALLIFDEVQTGVGRTGALYAYMNTGITPDILSTAKALGNGFPIGAMLTTESIAKSLAVGTHGSTYGGNPMACRVASEVIDIVSQPEVLAGIQDKHQLIVSRLKEINAKVGIFQEIRGEGLLIGAELVEDWAGRSKELVNEAVKHGLMILVAGPNVMRLTPSLVIEQADLEEGLDRLEKALIAITKA